MMPVQRMPVEPVERMMLKIILQIKLMLVLKKLLRLKVIIYTIKINHLLQILFKDYNNNNINLNR